MKITGWVIEYWNPISENVSYYSSLDGNWRSAESENVIYLWVFLGEYITVLKGKDFYFLSGNTFGCFNDDIKSKTSHDGHGCYYRIIDNELVRTQTPDHIRPKFVKDDEIKKGVWVTEPCATDLGLSPTSKKPRLIPDLKRYIS